MVMVQAEKSTAGSGRRACLSAEPEHENRRRRTAMLIDEILRALRDPEYRAQLTNEARGAMPDRPVQTMDHADSDQEPSAES
jgi:mersacidin/lichenicidin family type 2 lantibiotic